MKENVKNSKQKTNLFIKFVFVMGIFFIPIFVNAQVVITEIMYNPEGADDGREWVELYNNGNENIDISDWWFYESGNHGFQNEGAVFIGAGDYAVIVDNPLKFSTDYPNINTVILDSSAFSLKNTGDDISIRNAEKEDIDFVSYVIEQKSNIIGSSLQLINGEWKEASPTPGLPNVAGNTNSQTQTSPQEDPTTQTQNTVVLPELRNPKIFADAGKDKNVIVGADTQFKGMAFGLENTPIENAKFSWSFGDGDMQNGQNIMHNYKYPGDYVVMLNVSSGEYVASDRILVKALPADIVVSDVNNNFIELQNDSSYELNLSWWRIRSGTNFFTIPKDTIILPNSSLKISSKITGFYQNDLLQVFLLYPNGEIVNKYEITPVVIARSGAERNDVAIQENKNSKTQIQNSKQLQNIQTQEKQIINEEENLEVELPSDESEENLALVGSIGKDDNGLLNKWTFSLMGLILISIAGFFVVSKFDKENDEIKFDEQQLKPEDFKIIE